MNKTGGNAKRLQLPTSFKKRTDKKPGARFAAVGINYFENE